MYQRHQNIWVTSEYLVNFDGRINFGHKKVWAKESDCAGDDPNGHRGQPGVAKI